MPENVTNIKSPVIRCLDGPCAAIATETTVAHLALLADDSISLARQLLITNVNRLSPFRIGQIKSGSVQPLLPCKYCKSASAADGRWIDGARTLHARHTDRTVIATFP